MLAFLLQINAWVRSGQIYMFAIFMLWIWMLWLLRVRYAPERRWTFRGLTLVLFVLAAPASPEAPEPGR